MKAMSFLRANPQYEKKRNQIKVFDAAKLNLLPMALTDGGQPVALLTHTTCKTCKRFVRNDLYNRTSSDVDRNVIRPAKCRICNGEVEYISEGRRKIVEAQAKRTEEHQRKVMRQMSNVTLDDIRPQQPQQPQPQPRRRRPNINQDKAKETFSAYHEPNDYGGEPVSKKVVDHTPSINDLPVLANGAIAYAGHEWTDENGYLNRIEKGQDGSLVVGVYEKSTVEVSEYENAVRAMIVCFAFSLTVSSAYDMISYLLGWDTNPILLVVTNVLSIVSMVAVHKPNSKDGLLPDFAACLLACAVMMFFRVLFWL